MLPCRRRELVAEGDLQVLEGQPTRPAQDAVQQCPGPFAQAQCPLERQPADGPESEAAPPMFRRSP